MTHLLLTGGSRGIGAALIQGALERGLKVSVLGRSPSKDARVENFHCDLSDRSSVEAATSAVLRDRGAPDVVIHNAALIERASVEELSDEIWDRQMEVNLASPMRITRAFLPQMREKGRGRILFVSSISAVVGTKNQAAYNASKAGLLGLMRCLAEELSDTGLMTMALLPGSVDTTMLQGSGFPPRMQAEEVARTLLFHALDGSVAHNGAVVEMYGV